MSTKRGISVWIPAFMTFLSILATFAMAMRLVTDGASAPVSPYLIGLLFGSLNVETYLWIFIISTCVFLGITCLIVYRKQPPNPEIVKMLLKVGGNLAALRKSQETSMAEVANQMEYNRKVNRKMLTEISSELKEENKGMLAQLASQGRAVKKVRSDLISAVETKAAEAGEKVSADLKRQEASISGVKRLSAESATALKNQRVELEEIRLRLERIEGNMVPSQAKLKSLDNPEKIKGIGPALGKELKSLGIESVGDFLTTDPEVIGEKTRVSQEMAENLQAAAQLTMVPGVDADDAELLVEAGIKSRRELAGQDLIQLSRKVGEIAKVYLAQGKISKEEYPTIEEISSWIRNA